ncbi:MAG: thioredoxin domain-containing protein [Gemmatimonadetes bacterium]|nr:thioredoxin domain-containing protein [Gemmatimonadota bacterium]
MTETFRFSPRPNRAHQVHWQNWGRAALEEAAQQDKPVLLNLSAVWCRACQLMDETTYSDAAIIRLLNEQFLALRVDADRYPHVRDRYSAGGWPTNAFLTPTGEVLWAGNYVAPEAFRSVAEGVLAAWRGQRDELQLEIERRRKALAAARSRRPAVGLVRREAADDVLTAALDAFDARHGGFGTEPKFPQPHTIELLLVRGIRAGNQEWIEVASRTLDGMIAGQLWDHAAGGFFRYALAADWGEPRFEKLLDVNAGMLRAYSLGAQLLRRSDWAGVAERTGEWVERTLGQPHGLWGGSQAADEEYFRLSAGERAGRPAPYVDPSTYTNWAAHWIGALADAGARLGREAWIERAASALEVLLARMAAPGDLLHHFQEPGSPPAMPGLLVDLVEAARACMQVAQAAGDRRFIDQARRLAGGMAAALWADEGGFLDHTRSSDDVGALRYRDCPFDVNATAARMLIHLALATGERSYRGMAERVLAPLSPVAGRYGVAGASFALAVEEFFDPAGALAGR